MASVGGLVAVFMLCLRATSLELGIAGDSTGFMTQAGGGVGIAFSVVEEKTSGTEALLLRVVGREGVSGEEDPSE